jgi:hypothetical protein
MCYLYYDLRCVWKHCAAAYRCDHVAHATLCAVAVAVGVYYYYYVYHHYNRLALEIYSG